MKLGKEIVKILRGRSLIALEREQALQAAGALLHNPAVGAIGQMLPHLCGDHRREPLVREIIEQLLCLLAIHNDLTNTR